MVDVDNFKLFNDKHGHLAGDAALKIIAQRLNHRIQSKGFVARYGGEEFTLVLPGMTIEQSQAICEAIRAEFDSDQITLPSSGETLNSPTLSMGLAQFRTQETPEVLIDRADQALIRAKQAGRNIVELDG